VLIFAKIFPLKLIEIWKSQANIKKQNALTRKLKVSKLKELKLIADQSHQEVFSELSCLDCANCCKTIPPILNDNDIRRLAKSLGMKEKEFHMAHVRIDEDGDRVMAQTPCPFLLENNHCLVYDSRPRACREYPHTDGNQFAENLRLHAVNSTHCPAVFHILQRIEKHLTSS
ncbi:MAG TPA: YkgJ family cysteine cluster protein, partial [Bacteroidales bacterium]|nr:YkgJ family cysteine cluster protein [Bacteroidales bacterium]